jgi:sigma-E factor negative regulatory protein RseA
VAAAALMVSQPAGNHSERRAAPLTAQASGTPVHSAPAAAMQPSPEVAVVPQWLSGKAPGLLSQRASATLGAPAGADFSPYARDLSSFRAQRYRTLDNHDGSYLILLDPSQQQAPDAPRQGAASAQ